MVGVINPPQEFEGGYTIEGWEAASKNTTTTENDFVEAAQGGSFAKGGGGKGSGTKGNDSASATESGTPAASTSAGGASGLVVHTGFIGGMGALVAALML